MDFDQGSPKADLAAWMTLAMSPGGECSTAGKNCAELFTSLAMEHVAQNTSGDGAGDFRVINCRPC
jgi:hypothetical protein